LIGETEFQMGAKLKVGFVFEQIILRLNVEGVGGEGRVHIR